MILKLIIVFTCFTHGICSDNIVCDSVLSYNFKNNHHCWYDPDVTLNVPSIIKRHGYPLEVHEIITEDGYILTVFRIPKTIGRTGTVFLQHPATATCAAFVDIGRDSLAFVLADAGYDVWLGNFRGTSYSPNHTTLVQDSDEYWDFSFHEYGVYDTPAMLDAVKATMPHKEKLSYVGHSMSSTSAVVYASMLPEHAEKTVNVFVGYAPVVFMKNCKSPIRYFALFTGLILKLAKQYRVRSLYIHDSISHKLLILFCVKIPVTMPLCEWSTHYIIGFGPGYKEDNPKWFPVLFHQNFGGLSLKSVVHLSQCLKNRFSLYDYGSRQNLKRYGTKSPPLYPLGNITTPFYLVYGENDWMAVEKDVLTLYNKLPPAQRQLGLWKVPDFNHVQFMYGRDVQRVIYKPTLQFLNSIRNCTNC